MGNFEFKKKFGQNFLSDKNLLEKIVNKAEVSEEDIVLEIGAGAGTLTEVLSAHAKKVISFEIDKDLIEHLSEKFDGTNVELHFDDIMKIDDEQINNIVGGRFKLVANLPYYVTSPIITRFLQNENLVSLSVMVQEEVADRIIAQPQTKDYGVLTVICNLFGCPEKVLRVDRKMFYPVPNVDSAVIKIDKRENSVYKNSDGLISFVKNAFAMRRKKISSNLETNKISKSEIEQELKNLGLSESARAEELSLDKFIKLYEFFSDKNK